MINAVSVVVLVALKFLFRSALDQAMSNTLVRDDFHVRVTKSQRESMKFLATMTRALIDKYRREALDNLLEFGVFYERSRPDKPLKLKEVFCNMLICQRGLSAGMAFAISCKYPTIRSLKMAYDQCQSEEEKVKLVAGILYDNNTKKIPISVSKTLHHLFNDVELY